MKNPPCNYHPTRQALFCCEKCETAYCLACVSKREQNVYGRKETCYFCDKCNLPAKQLSFEHLITPFWNRLPGFFAYPLKLQPLLFMTVLSLIGAATSWNFLAAVFLWGLRIKYAYAVFLQTSRGKLRPPEVTSEAVTENFGQVFKQSLLYVVIGVLFVGVSANLGLAAGILYLIGALLFIPAMLMILVVTDNLGQALNPMAFIAVAWRIGWGYLMMYLFLLLMGGAPAIIGNYLPASLPPLFRDFLTLFAEQYYTIMAYSLMGYVCLQYHEKLNYPVSLEDLDVHKQALQKAESGPGETLLREANMLIKDGKMEEAISLIRERMAKGTPDRALSDKYYELLKISSRTGEMLLHAVPHLDLLASGNRKAPACGVYKECIALDPKFAPNPQSWFSVAGWLAQGSDYQLAVPAYANFIHAHPEHDLTAEAYFRLARLLHEKMKRSKKSYDILQWMEKKYPQHALLGEIRAYAGRISSGPVPSPPP
jgi:tetratricopeptide (TPR) repeat protein